MDPAAGGYTNRNCRCDHRSEWIWEVDHSQNNGETHETARREHVPRWQIYLPTVDEGDCQTARDIAAKSDSSGWIVSELVSYGRLPHQKGFGSLSKEDNEIIVWAMRMTGVDEFHDRPVDQLSGGQRQRAWIAMALAQGTDILFLDEPTTFLDMAHQLEVLKLLQKLNQEENRTIVMVVHDLNHASRYAHHMVAIKHGRVMSAGTSFEVMTKDILREVFGIEADIIPDPQSRVPL